jgi:hypothetical protein
MHRAFPHESRSSKEVTESDFELVKVAESKILESLNDDAANQIRFCAKPLLRIE